MRPILGAVFAAGLLLVSTSAARAQSAGVGGPYVVPAGGFAPALPPSIYATDMLPASLTHPWVMVPRFSTAAIGLNYGNRFSPYGIYSRYAFYTTGPYPGVIRPYARFEKGWHD